MIYIEYFVNIIVIIPKVIIIVKLEEDKLKKNNAKI